MGPIYRDSPIPLYYQLKQILKREIRKGTYGVGERIPTEAELCEIFGISRTPVRQALSELAQEGILRRHRRRGTFVMDPLRPPERAMERTTLRVLIEDSFFPCKSHKSLGVSVQFVGGSVRGQRVMVAGLTAGAIKG